MGQFAEVVAENLFVKVSEQMEWLNANVGALQLALEKTPEVFESVCVNLLRQRKTPHGQQLGARIHAL